MKIKEVILHLERKFPLYWQEEYDNCGVQCGDKEQEITGALVCFNFSEKAIEEAIARNANLIISHHPLIFKGLQKIEPTSPTGRMIFKAIQHKLVLYSMHTNIDNGIEGGNWLFAKKLGLKELKVLAPKEALFRKLVFYAPNGEEVPIIDALFTAGCGAVGNYINCSFRAEGKGTFQPLKSANPFIGQADVTEMVDEVRVEMIFPKAIQQKVIKTLYRHHPYEEPAFDIFALENSISQIGLGSIGTLPQSMRAEYFFDVMKKELNIEYFRISGKTDRTIQKVAVCGGSGSSFIRTAFAAGADIFITGDVKYHDFFSVDNQMIIADIGHFEGESFIKEIIYNELKENFSNFATIILEGEKSGIILV